jgi:hypothetical protein
MSMKINHKHVSKSANVISPEIFEKINFRLPIVIPSKAGIQHFQVITGFRVKPGMTERGVFQRSPPANGNDLLHAEPFLPSETDDS